MPAAAVRLRVAFDAAVQSRRINGSLVLAQLARLSFEFIKGGSDEEAAIAFALGSLLSAHSDDREERPVTSEEGYAFSATALEPISEAIRFLENGGSADDIVRVIASLAHLTPDALYRPEP